MVFVSRELTANTGEAVILLEATQGIIPVTLIVEP
jgi:hypothetical protein